MHIIKIIFFNVARCKRIPTVTVYLAKFVLNTRIYLEIQGWVTLREINLFQNN